MSLGYVNVVKRCRLLTSGQVLGNNFGSAMTKKSWTLNFVPGLLNYSTCWSWLLTVRLLYVADTLNFLDSLVNHRALWELWSSSKSGRNIPVYCVLQLRLVQKKLLFSFRFEMNIEIKILKYVKPCLCHHTVSRWKVHSSSVGKVET